MNSVIFKVAGAAVKALGIKGWAAIGIIGILLSVVGKLYVANSQLELEVELHKLSASSTLTIKELNERLMESNQTVLLSAIDKQNQLFSALATENNDRTQLIMLRLDTQHQLSAEQHKRVATAIDAINILNCQQMVDEMINFSVEQLTWED